jgi:gliding motility-associated-like protein
LYATPKSYAIQLVVKHDGCFDTTLHRLVVHPKPVVTLPVKTATVCLDKSIQLNASGGDVYRWTPAIDLSNDRISNPVATPKNSATYIVKVDNSFGCSALDSVVLNVVKPFKLSYAKDTFVCKGSSVQLRTAGATSYQWINNTVGLNDLRTNRPVATPFSSTTYTVVGFDAYQCFTDTGVINVAVQPLPTVNAGADVQILANTPHQLQAAGSNDVKVWKWSPEDFLSCVNCPSPITTPRREMDYIVSVKNEFGCEAKDTIHIKLECSQGYVFIPNTFTPNHDGKNDVFAVTGRGVGMIKSLRLFNRWGEMVFERTNFAIGDAAGSWNGLHKGVPVPFGSYVYFVELECDGGEPFTKKGTVTVVY